MLLPDTSWSSPRSSALAAGQECTWDAVQQLVVAVHQLGIHVFVQLTVKYGLECSSDLVLVGMPACLDNGAHNEHVSHMPRERSDSLFVDSVPLRQKQRVLVSSGHALGR